MKLASIALLSTLAVISAQSHASNNTYVYSNTEYCKLAASNTSAAHLNAYSDKLGFTPAANECRVLLGKTGQSKSVATEQDIRKLLREVLNGSVIRPTAALSRKLAELPEEQRYQAIMKLFG